MLDLEVDDRWLPEEHAVDGGGGRGGGGDGGVGDAGALRGLAGAGRSPAQREGWKSARGVREVAVDGLEAEHVDDGGVFEMAVRLIVERCEESKVASRRSKVEKWLLVDIIKRSAALAAETQISGVVG